MKFTFDNEDEKSRFCQFVKKLALLAENGDVELSEKTSNTFHEFWVAYPLKKGKKPAQLKYERLKEDEKTQAIQAAKALRREYERRPKEDAQYIPHATTFINQKRWEDLGIDLKNPAYQAIQQSQKLPSKLNSLKQQ